MSEKKDDSQKIDKAPPFFCLRCRPHILAFPLWALALTAALFWVAPRLFQEGFLFPLAQNIASLHYDVTILAKSARINLSGDPYILLNEVSFSKGKDQPALAARLVKLDMNLVNVLTGEPVVEKLTIVSPKFTIVRRKDGSYNVPGLSPDEEPQAPSTAAAALLEIAAKTSLYIIGGTVDWSDSYISDKTVQTTVKNVTALIEKKGAKGSTHFRLSGLLGSKRGASAFRLNGVLSAKNGEAPSFTGKTSIDRISVDEYWTYLSHILPFDQIDCDLSIEADFSGDFARGFSSKGSLLFTGLTIYYEKMFSRSLEEDHITLTYDVKSDKERLDINSVFLTAGPIAISARGKANNILSKNPDLDIQISAKPVAIEDLQRYLPDNTLPHVLSKFILSNLKSGEITLSGLRFNGDLDKLKNLDQPESLDAFSGTVSVSDLTIAFNRAPKNFTNIGGEITLDNNQLAFSDITGRYGENVLNKISGVVANIDKSPIYNIYINANFDVAQAKELFAAEITSREFKKKIDDIEWAEGFVGLDLRIAGATADPVSSLSLKGTIKLSDVGMMSSALGLPIYDLNGVIEGNFKDIRIAKLNWIAGESPFTLSGDLYDVFGEDPTFDLFLATTAQLTDMEKIRFLTTNKRRQNQSGVAEIVMTVKGSFGDFEVNNSVDMTNASFALPGFIEKEKGSKLIYKFEGVVKNNQRVTIRNLDLTIGDSVIDVTGRIDQFLWGEGINLTFTTDGFLLDDADSFFTFFDDIDGEGLVKGSISINTTSQNSVSLVGAMTADNVTFKLPTFSETFSEGNATFLFSRNKIFLKNARGKFGAGAFSGNGIAILGPTPKFTINVKTDALNLDDLFGDKRRKEKKTDEEDTKNYMDGIWVINVHSDKGKIGMLTYNNLDTAIHYDSHVFSISPFSFSAHGGVWSLEGIIDTLKPDKIGFDTVLQIQDLDMTRFEAEALGSGARFISGPFNLRGVAKGEGATWYDIKRSMEGMFTLRSGAGVIRKFTMLSKIFSILNVSQYFLLRAPQLDVEGMPFNSISANFIVKDGIATTDQLVVDSEAIRLVADGNYDIAQNAIDMKILAAPLVAVDRVLSSIPLVGYVLTGDDKGFLTSSFTVKGPLDDPEVNMIPFESLARGVLGILERFIMAPVVAVRALSGDKEPEFVLPFEADIN